VGLPRKQMSDPGASHPAEFTDWRRDDQL